MIHIGLSIFLVFLLFRDRFVTTEFHRNLFVVFAMVVFAVAAATDVRVALLVAAISYVVLSKVKLEEKFFSTKSNTPKVVAKSDKKETPETKTTTPLPSKVNVDDKAPAPQKTGDDLPAHCSKIGIRDDAIPDSMNELPLEDIQSNVFDKYNMNVFYHEAGTNSMDIQGIFNHEVVGYERM